MAHLSISTLGSFQARLDGQPVTGFESNKVRGLLAYLAVEAQRPHPREVLASMFWPEMPERSALSNLRYALSNLRQAIGDRQAQPPFLLITTDALQFNTASDYDLDVQAFEAGVEAGSAETLKHVVGLYHGPFLEGFAVADSASFEDWLILNREQLHRQMLKALYLLTDECERSGASEEAGQYAWRQVELEPWREEGRQQLMRILALTGQRSAALAQYDACRRLLADELGVEPSDETTALFESIRDGTIKRIAPSPASDELPPEPGMPPYKGLQYFDDQDAGIFHGREKLVARLVWRINTTARFLAIIGASGSGKSSLVRAGLIPALRRAEPLIDGTLPPQGSHNWLVSLITPTEHPIEALAASLTRLSGRMTALPKLIDDLARDPHALDAYARRLLDRSTTFPGAPGRPDGVSRLLLVVDQFEELFTLCRDEVERTVFIDSLLAACGALENESGGDGPVMVVIALRADFYTHCAQYVHLREALCAWQEYIGPMNEAELRQVIEEPARQAGWNIEPGLVNLILRDIGEEPGALPLLSHALLETWQRRRGRWMTLNGYAEAGGVHGAIANTAGAVFSQLGPQQQLLTKRVFLRLTELGESTLDTRRRVVVEELIFRPEDAALIQSLLQRLAEARLITLAEGTAEVAHEALIREWPALREWLNEDRENLRLHRHLTESARAWQDLNRDPGELYRGGRLAQALEWAAQPENPEQLNPLERSYLDASRQVAEKEADEREAQRLREVEAARRLAETEKRRFEEQRRSNLRLRRRAVILAAASLAAGVLAVIAFVFGQQARQNQQLAISRELAAASINNMGVNPELSLLLALQAARTAHTLEAETALHRALPAQHVLFTLAGHTAMLRGVAYSPDGARLATAGYDNTAKIWDAATGKELLTLEGHTYWVNGVDFSPDGLRIATASADGTVIVWDAATGGRLLTLAGHDPDKKSGFYVGVLRAVYSPDGRRIASAASDGLVKVWDATAGTELFSLGGDTGAALSAAFSPDGVRLAVGYSGNIAKVWDIEAGVELGALQGHTQAVQGVAFSPDGSRLATAGEEGVGIVWDSLTGEKLLTLEGHSGGLWAVDYSPDGARLATSSYDGTARLWDAATGKELLSLAGHSSSVLDVVFSPDGNRLATAGGEHTAKIWDISPGRELLTLVGPPGPSVGASFSPDGLRLVTGSTVDGSLIVLDIASRQTLLSLPAQGAPVLSIALSPDGAYLAAGCMDGTVKLWALSLSGNLPAAREIPTQPAHTNWVFGLAFSPDGGRLATVSFDGTMIVWESATGRQLLNLAAHADETWGVAFSPDGKTLATVSRDTTAKLWNAATGELVLSIPHQTFLLTVAFSPDGKQLATAGLDGLATVWDIADILSGGAAAARKTFTLSRHNGLIVQVSYSPDGTRLATASFDGTSKVWDAATGLELFTLYGHTANVLSVAFSPDGARLVTTSFDGTTRFYALRLKDLLLLAEARLTRSLTAEECQSYLHVETCP